ELDNGAIPRNRGCTIEQAISDGEDYELLFAIAPRDAPRLQKTWRVKFPRLRLTRIGCLKQKSQARDQEVPAGYAHFR
ncbi:MAG: hypothetical protein M3505_06650, partial [Verrucomicrobiota bacterium]|nr:hypothetical protein [Verrucomicrobiota bacterium]